MRKRTQSGSTVSPRTTTFLVIVLLVGCFGCLLSLLFSFRISVDYSNQNAYLQQQDCSNSETQRKPKIISTIPPFIVDPVFQAEHYRIDHEDVETKCSRYNLKPNYYYSHHHHPDEVGSRHPPRRRRIFYGAMVADEHWDVWLMNAVEVYNVFHTMIFVESNTTHMATPRNMRFYSDNDNDDLITDKNAVLYSNMFGNHTNVQFYFWLHNEPDLLLMDRESEQRNTILQGWKDAGMTVHDVGLVADIDEVVSRDFLRAVQLCDFPELRHTTNELYTSSSCQKPKIVPNTISFESSPYCIKHWLWFHPDFIGGDCIEGIGDPTERIVPLRTHKRHYGQRHESYGQRNLEQYPKYIQESNRYPLYNAPDVRTVHGDRGHPYTFHYRPGEHAYTAVYGVAFHFHNWFPNHSSIRHKYQTYAHANKDAKHATLSQVGLEDLDITVRCIHGINNKANPNDWAKGYFLNGSQIKGPKPIYFLNQTYVATRHELVKQMILQDEALYGSSYDINGKWVNHNAKNVAI